MMDGFVLGPRPCGRGLCRRPVAWVCVVLLVVTACTGALFAEVVRLLGPAEVGLVLLSVLRRKPRR